MFYYLVFVITTVCAKIILFSLQQTNKVTLCTDVQTNHFKEDIPNVFMYTDSMESFKISPSLPRRNPYWVLSVF